MSAVEESKSNISVKPTWQTSFARAVSNGLTWLLNLLSSVRFGVTLLVLLVIAAMIGMLIMQQNVEGFESYYSQLTPSQQLLYGSLNFFDIYHSRYFNALLLVLSLNIVLASIDRFPKAWTFISRPKLDASINWLRGQEQTASLSLEGMSRRGVAERVAAAYRSIGLRPRVTEKGHRTFVFGQKGAWNRLGAYAVHVALLTIFTGGFIFAQLGHTGRMWVTPNRPMQGQEPDEITELVHDLDKVAELKIQLPFTVSCTDIQQKLINKDGPIDQLNTTDWLTRIKIKDKQTGAEQEALVHLNAPYDYGNYRFFQESFIGVGKARTITVRLTPAEGGASLEATIPRDGAVTLENGTEVQFADFAANFSLGRDDEEAEESEYNNPAATLIVTPPGGRPAQAFAFGPEMAAAAPIAKKPVAGYTYVLTDFEKVPVAHALSIQYNPGVNTIYAGFALLGLTLVSVFFFSHQRVWALIEEGPDGNFDVTLGGNTNRNKLAFEERFKSLTNTLRGQAPEAEEES